MDRVTRERETWAEKKKVLWTPTARRSLWCFFQVKQMMLEEIQGELNEMRLRCGPGTALTTCHLRP